MYDPVFSLTSIAWDGRTRFGVNRPLIGWRDPAVHAKRRQPWTRGMSTSALKEYEPILAGRISQLVNAMLQTQGKSVDLGQMIKYFS